MTRSDGQNSSGKIYETPPPVVMVAAVSSPIFPVSLRMFHFMTSKVVNHDRNGQVADNFFDYGAMI